MTATLKVLLLLLLAGCADTCFAQTAEATRAKNWLTLQKLLAIKASAPWHLSANDLQQINLLQGIAASAICTNVKVSKCNGVVLPVTGLELKGKRINSEKVTLTWETKAEYNSKGFILERKSFNESNVYDSIFFTTGAGTSYSKRKYEHIDVNSFQQPSFYRVKEVDKDGNITFSNIVQINNTERSFTVDVAPNPAKSNNVRLYFSTPNTGTSVSLIICNAIGVQLVNRQNIQVSNGFYELKNTTLAPGYYFVTVYTATNVYTKPFIILD